MPMINFHINRSLYHIVHSQVPRPSCELGNLTRVDSTLLAVVQIFYVNFVHIYVQHRLDLACGGCERSLPHPNVLRCCKVKHKAVL